MGEDAANQGDGLAEALSEAPLSEKTLQGKPPLVDCLPAAVARWELSGGTWRVQSLTGDRAVVELRRCDGGEIADLTTLTGPHDLHWARAMLAEELHSADAVAADNPAAPSAADTDVASAVEAATAPSTAPSTNPPAHPRSTMTRHSSHIANTPWAESLGLAAPIVCAPMGGAAGGRLAAAVSLAGGLGMIGMGSAGSAAALERELEAFTNAVLASTVRANTVHASTVPASTAQVNTQPTPPFGIGMVDWGIAKHPDMFERALAAKPALISVSFGEWTRGTPAPAWIARAKASGAKTIAQVATLDEAKAAADAGIDAVVARGLEGGGHGDHAEPLASLLEAVLEAVDIPVLAAGAVSTAQDVQRVLHAGAAAAWVGTAFAACEESLTPAAARAAMIAARGSGTFVTRVYDVALDRPWPARFPERLIPTPFVTEWQGCEDELAVNENAKREFRAACEIGDFTVVPVDAGQGVDLVTSVRPAAEVLRELAGQ